MAEVSAKNYHANDGPREIAPRQNVCHVVVFCHVVVCRSRTSLTPRPGLAGSGWVRGLECVLTDLLSVNRGEQILAVGFSGVDDIGQVIES